MKSTVRRRRKSRWGRSEGTPASARGTGLPVPDWLGALAMLLLAAGGVYLILGPEPERLSSLVGHVHVVDGDTLRFGGERIRLRGLDAPERAQTCTHADGANWPCGEAAERMLSELVAGSSVECAPFGRDQYDRVLARCTVGKTDVGAEVVRHGYAIADGEYEAEEREARAARRGIWNGSFQRPREYRDEVSPFDLFGLIRSWFG